MFLSKTFTIPEGPRSGWRLSSADKSIKMVESEKQTSQRCVYDILTFQSCFHHSHGVYEVCDMFVLCLAVTQLQFTMFLGITLWVDWGRKRFPMTACGLWALQVPLMMLLGLKSDWKANRIKKTLCPNRKAVGQDLQAGCPHGCGNIHRAFPVFWWPYPLWVHQIKLKVGECTWESGAQPVPWVLDQFMGGRANDR